MWEGETFVPAPIILFSADIFLSAVQRLFKKKITVRQDRITYSTLIPSPSLMQQKRVTAELSQTSFCSHSKLARLLALPSQIRIRQWPLCKVSLSDFC